MLLSVVEKEMSGSSGDWEPLRGVKDGGMGKLKRVLLSASSAVETEKMETRSTASDLFSLVAGLRGESSSATWSSSANAREKPLLRLFDEGVFENVDFALDGVVPPPPTRVA